MSIEPGAKNSSEPSTAHESLDLTGLPTPIAQELRRLVATLRSNLAGTTPGTHSGTEPPDQWTRRLQAWVDSHPPRDLSIDDSRESVYAGRGE
jgi:hypothetical protein